MKKFLFSLLFIFASNNTMELPQEDPKKKGKTIQYPSSGGGCLSILIILRAADKADRPYPPLPYDYSDYPGGPPTQH